VIELSGVIRRYDRTIAAVDDLDLQVPRGAVLALLGPSGCGKTTTLRLIAGLEVPDGGSIVIAGGLVAGTGSWVPPEERGVGLVFQDGALFPHMTVAQNIAFGLRTQARADRERRVAEMLVTVGLMGLGGRYPHQLSGGQQQRVALARALAPEPPILLLDEPFANLDAALRRELRIEVARIVRALGTTTIFVTHDQEEALSVADLVAVMERGRVAQIDIPQRVYTRPASQSIAAFVGEANFLPALAHGMRADSALGALDLVGPIDGPALVLIRPEQLVVTPHQHGAGQITQIIYYGHDQLVHVQLTDGAQLLARMRPGEQLTVGMRVEVLVRGLLVGYAGGS
jgi:iron(III) transport system ATP-binding protein